MMNGTLVTAYRRWRDAVEPERHIVRRFIRTHLTQAPPTPGLCLDVGAGIAPFAPTLRSTAPDARHVAVDRFADEALTAVVADASALPFAPGTAAVVCLFQVLAHLPEPAEALAEARRVLAPGGVLLISYPLLCPEGRSRDLWRWTRPGMERLLDRAGFEVLAHEPQGGGSLFLTGTLASIPGRLLIRHRQGWRSGRGLPDALRLALAAALAAPFHLLGFAAWFLDRLFDPEPAYYIGGTVLARPRAEGLDG